jgi:hypothetical protein
MIDPTEVGGRITKLTKSGLRDGPFGIAFDGSRIWTANIVSPPGTGSISIITPTEDTPWSVTNVTTGFSNPDGILFDGSNIWVTDIGANTLLKLDQSGRVVQTVNVGIAPNRPAFDGTNIWVPNAANSTVSVVRAATGAVVATLSGNGLSFPQQAAFDGQRILVTSPSVSSVSLWKAADLTPIGTFFTGTNSGPYGACSDGTYFWITLITTSQLARF